MVKLKMLPEIYRIPLYAGNLKRAIAFEREREKEERVKEKEKEKEEKEREKGERERDRGKSIAERKVRFVFASFFVRRRFLR
jgi:hypothetical protein